MCGLAGVLGTTGIDKDILFRMGNAIAHRGPDDYGEWFNVEDGIGFTHRRLSILDLSSAGHQPMSSGNERYVIAFNGEIYNHLDIRKELNGTDWRGHSDTETLLSGFQRWGIRETIVKSVGMFAIAVWDKHEKVLTLVRDRVGEKPLYYGWQGQGDNAVFLFGSELNAIKIHPKFNANIDRNSLCLLLRHNYVPAPYSIYENIYKLEPGCFLSVSLKSRVPKVEKYWSACGVASSGVANPFHENSEQLLCELEDLLKSVVRQQMLSDVPLGAFLSGGVDSSTIVALMQSQSSRPVKTFTIGFSEKEFNEAQHAKSIASYLGTDHTELYVTPKDAMNVIPKLPNIYSEPFSDSSQIPTFLVSELASQHVKVALSGDAGDEIFCGYNRYLLTEHVWKRLSKFPVNSRKGLAFGMRAISPANWNKLASYLGYLIPKNLRQVNLGDKLHKAADVIGANTADELYLGLVSHWTNPASVVIGGVESVFALTRSMPQLSGLTHVQRMMVLDMITYLPDDILVKVDRAAMGSSLETRVPFLDHRVIEFAWRLPSSMKLNNGQTKWALRQLLYRYVPKELFERPKIGFGIPLHDWLRGPLRDWAEDLLSESKLKRQGYFDAIEVRQKWKEHLSLQRNWQYLLWDILMFQAWLESC